jgi:hypothetical protein
MKEIMSYQEIVSNVFYIRNKKVMLDFHLAVMYEVETRVLKQQIKRNRERFPEDFMFQLTENEWKELITNCDKLGAYKFSPAIPLAFTEQGVAMLSGILRSPLAIKVNIAIMRAFVKMREILDNNKELKEKIEQLEAKYDKQFSVVFEAIKLLIQKDEKPRNPVGFKIARPDKSDIG